MKIFNLSSYITFERATNIYLNSSRGLNFVQQTVLFHAIQIHSIHIVISTNHPYHHDGERQWRCVGGGGARTPFELEPARRCTLVPVNPHTYIHTLVDAVYLRRSAPRLVYGHSPPFNEEGARCSVPPPPPPLVSHY